MEIYIEMIYLLLFITCVISLESMSVLLNTVIWTKEILFRSGLLSFAILGLYVDCYLLFLYWFLLFGWWYQKQIFLYFPIFLIIYLSLVFFFHSLITGSFLFQGILLVDSQCNIFYYGMVLIVMALLELLFLLYSKRKVRNHQFYYDFELWWKGEKIIGSAFLDTGNNLYYQGFPLMIIRSSCIEGYFEMDQLESSGVQQRTIDITKIEQIVVNKQKLKNIYVGVVDEMDYDVLLHHQLMGGIL